MVNVKLIESLNLPEKVVELPIDQEWTGYIRIQCTLQEMLDGAFWPQLYCLVNILAVNNALIANFMLHTVTFWIEDCLPFHVRLVYYIPPIIYWETFTSPTPRILYVGTLSEEQDNPIIMPMQLLRNYANACMERGIDHFPGMPWYDDLCQVLFELQKLNRQWTEQTFDLNLGLFQKMSRCIIYPENIFEYYDDVGQIHKNDLYTDKCSPLDQVAHDLTHIKRGEELVRLSPILIKHMEDENTSQAQTIVDLVFSQNTEYKRHLANGPRPYNLLATGLKNVKFLDDQKS